MAQIARETDLVWMQSCLRVNQLYHITLWLLLTVLEHHGRAVAVVDTADTGTAAAAVCVCVYVSAEACSSSVPSSRTAAAPLAPPLQRQHRSVDSHESRVYHETACSVAAGCV